MFRRLAVIVAILALQGCSTYAVNRYSMSMDNVEKIRKVANGGVISVGGFTATEPARSEIMCRGVGPIKTPDGETYEAYIRKALIDELRLAEAYNETSTVKITGNLDSIDFSSVEGTWSIAVTIASGQGRRFSVTENYKYTTSYFGETACNQTAQAVMPAVQDLVKSVVSHPEFQAIAQEK